MNYRRVFIPKSIIFITLVTKNRVSLLLKNVELLFLVFKQTKEFYDYKILSYVVLENHVHLLLRPQVIEDYPKIIHSMKYNFTKNVGIAMPTYAKIDVWQKRYFEHTITNEDDLNKHLDYIHYNPVKHGYVSRVKDWKYSSFWYYVEKEFYDVNWCNFEDRYKINECNYE